MKNAIMLGLVIALGAVNVMLAGCGSGYGDSGSDWAESDYGDCDSYAFGADYYAAGESCEYAQGDIEAAAYEDCQGDDYCVGCMLNSYDAGASGCGDA